MLVRGGEGKRELSSFMKTFWHRQGRIWNFFEEGVSDFCRPFFIERPNWNFESSQITIKTPIWTNFLCRPKKENFIQEIAFYQRALPFQSSEKFYGQSAKNRYLNLVQWDPLGGQGVKSLREVSVHPSPPPLPQTSVRYRIIFYH